MATSWTAARNDYVAANGLHSATSDGGDEVYRVRTDGTSIFFSKSVDEGQNYATEVTVAAVGDQVAYDNAIVRDPVSGRLFVFYGRLFGSGSFNALLLYRYSDDDGATWSAEQTLDDGTSYAVNKFYRIAATARNNVVNVLVTVIDSSTFSGTGAVYLYRSTNGGGSPPTFGKSTPFTAVSLGNPERPTVCDDGSTIHFAWYDNGANGGGNAKGGDIIYAKSPDLGLNWSMGTAATVAQIDALDGGARPAVTAALGVVNIAFMAPWGVGIVADTWLAQSFDNGITWVAPRKIVTHSGSFQLEHPAIAARGRYVYLVADDTGVTPQVARVYVSADYGTTWGSPTTVFTYSGVAGGNGDAPYIFHTRGCVHVYVADPANSNNAFYVRNPVWMRTPDITRVLDDCTRANAGAPPSTSAQGQAWSGSTGSCVSTGSAGDGLVVVSNAIARASAGSFRCGSWLTASPPSADHEIGVRWKNAKSGWGANDGVQLYTRLQSPPAAAGAFHAVEFFNDGNPVAGTDNLVTFASVTNASLTAAAGDYLFIQSVGKRHRVWSSSDGATWALVMNWVDTGTAGNGKIGIDFTNSQTPATTRVMGGAVVDDLPINELDPGPIYRPVVLPVKRVGPMALRQRFRQPWVAATPETSVAAPPTSTVSAPAVLLPNARVGPMALRQRFRRAFWPQTVVPAGGSTTPQPMTATSVLATASIQNQTNKTVSATAVAATGSMQRQVGKLVTATSVAATATMLRQINKTLTATTVAVTASMIALKVILRTLSATAVVVTASMQRQVNKLATATAVAVTASIVKQINKSLTATTVVVTATLAALKVILKTLTATTVLVTAAMQRQIGKPLIATTVAVTASLVKQVNKTLTATSVAVTASLVALKVFLRTMTATAVAVTASMQRQTGKQLSATSAVTATITRQIAKSITAVAVAVTATIAKQVGKTLRATSVAVTATLTTSRLYARVLSATVAATATMRRGVSTTVSATSSVTASITKTITKTLSGSAAATASMVATFISGAAGTIVTAFFHGRADRNQFKGQPDRNQFGGKPDRNQFRPPDQEG